jgi:hypothetical protein
MFLFQKCLILSLPTYNMHNREKHSSSRRITHLQLHGALTV